MHTFNFVTPAVIACVCLLICGCGGFGPKTVHNGTEVYFSGGTTKQQADKLGQLLVEEGFADGAPKSVQLRKVGDDRFEFRIVTKPEFFERKEFANSFKFISLQVSNLLDGQKVSSHLCDDSFSTKKVIEGLQGNIQVFGNAQVYIHGISESQIANLQSIMEENGLHESEGSYHVSKEGDQFVVRMVVGPDFFDNAEVLEDVKRISLALSEKAFDGATVEWNLCNDNFTSQNSVSAAAAPVVTK
jgi:hypothetical protein